MTLKLVKTKTPQPPARFLTPAQLSERWVCHEETIRRKIRQREIAAYLPANGAFLLRARPDWAAPSGVGDVSAVAEDIALPSD